MDKLKESLGPVYKHAFWVTCGVIVVVSLGMWFVSTQLSLRKKTQENVATVDAAFSTIDEVNNAGVSAAGETEDATSSIKFHPNEISAKETERLNDRLKASVAEAWFEQYQHQRDLFVWPEKLSKGFKNAVRSKLQMPRWQFTVEDEQIIVDVRNEEDAIRQIAEERSIDPAKLRGKGRFIPYQLPIEVAVPFPTQVDDEVSDVFRRIYRDFIKGHVPTLAEKIGASWNPTGDAMSASGDTGESMVPMSTTDLEDPSISGEAGEEVEPDTVTWNPQNEGHWQTKLTAFPDRAAQDYVPTTLQMLYAQEDLWVLEALLNIIKATNGDVTLKHEAAIKEIDFLLTGKDAGEMPGTITPIGRSSSMTGEGGSGYGEDFGEDSYGGDDMESSGDDYGESFGEGEDLMGEDGQPASSAADPANDRYVDRDFKMIDGSKLREVFAQEPTIEDAYLRVAKRIPVRIGLQMDARKLNVLLAACANSPLVVEVRQVRINRHSPGDAGGDGMGAAGDDEGMGGGTVYADFGAGGSGAGGDPMMEGGESTLKSGHDVPVEIYGVVMIYNPVDAKTLDVKPGEDEEPKKDDATPKPDTSDTASTN